MSSALIINEYHHNLNTPVTIIGGGIGGLTLARMLYIHDIPVTVYEAEHDRHTRTQGGQLDIHEHNGQIALEAIGLTEQFHDIIHEGADATKIVDSNASTLLDIPSDASNARPEVLRVDLRQMLLDSLPENIVQWNKKVSHVEHLENGQHTIHFADASTTTSDLLIGADGAWSKVRPLLSDAKPEYSGYTFVENFLRDADTQYPKTAEKVGDGAMYALTPDKGIVAHREAGDVLHTYIQLKCDLDWISNIDFTNSTASTQVIAEQFEGWAPELTALITEGSSNLILRKIYALPDEHRWQRTPGVTLLGDAAHLMAPSGEGANLAIYDAAELGKLIVEYPNDIELALENYEQALFKRSAAEAEESHELLDLCLGQDAPYGLIALFEGSNEQN
ncbi:NAD(P)/FAD-dependent oxidoreductase [Staphylococcus sp. GDX8P107P-1]|uniref:FAD-dependent oxidoreductase n=1 Tax=Staphylococcus sp. GDX8P107P-1 TaxID=2804109 RepID=UPI001FD910ED|nr:NAD(P)/FAD-dependent oxidoreductase [Staphylococcus sp. GDX8P107P-1]